MYVTDAPVGAPVDAVLVLLVGLAAIALDLWRAWSGGRSRVERDLRIANSLPIDSDLRARMLRDAQERLAASLAVPDRRDPVAIAVGLTLILASVFFWRLFFWGDAATAAVTWLPALAFAGYGVRTLVRAARRPLPTDDM